MSLFNKEFYKTVNKPDSETVTECEIQKLVFIASTMILWLPSTDEPWITPEE